MSEEKNENLNGEDENVNPEVNEDNEDIGQYDDGSDLNEKPKDDSDAGNKDADKPDAQAGKKADDGHENINQDAVNKRINKFVREKKEAEERYNAEVQRRADLERRLAELEKTKVPEIPEVPDYLDVDYDEKIAERDRIIRLHAQEEAKKAALEQEKQKSQQLSYQQEQQRVNELVSNFDKRVADLKVDKAKIEEGAGIVAQYLNGKPDVAQYLLGDENGPLSVLYLSQNVEELDKVSRMSDVQAAVYLATNISQKAAGLKPKTTTTAPDPGYDPSGNKANKHESPYLSGAKFE